MSIESHRSIENTKTASEARSLDLVLSKRNSPLNPAEMYLLSLNTEITRGRVRDLLNSVARALGGNDLHSFLWETITPEDLLRYRDAQRAKGLKPSTINMRLATVRSVLNQAYVMGLISFEQHFRLAEVKRVKGATVPKGRALSEEEVTALLTEASRQGTVIGIRNAAIVSLAVGCGLRRAEMAALLLSDLDIKRERILIKGKGNKERWAYLSDSVKKHLESWLAVRGTGPDEHVFLCVRSFNYVQADHPLLPEGFYTALERLAADAGVNRFSPHDLRRTFATRLLHMGAPLENVQKAMGHTSLMTTQRYDKRDREDIVRSLTMMLDM